MRVACVWLSFFAVLSYQCGAMASYRLRSPFLRAVHNKIVTDMEEKGRSHDEWYRVDTELLPEDVCAKFVPATEDEETKEFLESCYDKSDWVFTQIGHMVARGVLGWFMTPTSINGLLQRGSMFVFSKELFRQLMQVDDSWKADKLLDLGAGDGMVTKQMAAHFREVYTTETSSTMIWRLQEKGYINLGIEEWQDGRHKYDVISCLNLMDRCERPIKLLRDMHNVIKPDGRVIVAVVLPFKPYCEFGGVDNKPFEFLHVEGSTFEDQVTSFIKNVFELSDFEVVSFTRVPYLCEGDLERSFYILNDALFVLKPVEKDQKQGR